MRLEAPLWDLETAIRWTTPSLDKDGSDALLTVMYMYADEAIDARLLKSFAGPGYVTKVRPFDFLKWRATLTFAGPMPPEMEEFLRERCGNGGTEASNDQPLGVEDDPTEYLPPWDQTPRRGHTPKELREMEKEAMPEGEEGWDMALASHLWKLPQAIRLTTTINVSKEEQRSFDRLNKYPAIRITDYAVVRHPLAPMALDAIEAGDVKNFSGMEPVGPTYVDRMYSAKVKPMDFLKWREGNAHVWPLRQEMQDAIVRYQARRERGLTGRTRNGADSPGHGDIGPAKIHGNSLVNARKHEEILGAALACLVKYPQLCKSMRGDEIAATGISRTMQQLAEKLFPETGDLPMSEEGITDLLRKHIQKLQGKKVEEA